MIRNKKNKLRISDTIISKHFHTTNRNLLETYKRPQKVSDEKKLIEKKDKYNLLRLGATCLEYGIDEEQLLLYINSDISVAQNLQTICEIYKVNLAELEILAKSKKSTQKSKKKLLELGLFCMENQISEDELYKFVKKRNIAK